MRTAAIVAIIALAAAVVASPAAAAPAAEFVHAGYGYDMPRGCRFVIRIVVVNGIEISLRYVVCPPSPAPEPAAPIG